MKRVAPKYPHFVEARAAYWHTPAGERALATAYYARPGFLSPMTVLVFYRGRWRAPIEQKRLGLAMTVYSCLKTVYRKSVLEKALYQPNPFFSLIEKSNDWRGGYVPVPLPKGKP